MDNETLNKIGGKIRWIDVPYTTTKLSVETAKNKWQTAGGDTIIARTDVGAEADPLAVFNATREWLKEIAVAANKEKLDALRKAYEAYHAPSAPTMPVAPSVAQHAQQPTPAQQPAGDKTFVVETLSVSIMDEKRYMKAKGGRFSKYGVNVWEEVAAMPPLEWDLELLDGADYPAPAGLTAIYSEKTADSGKVVPDKVTAWK